MPSQDSSIKEKLDKACANFKLELLKQRRIQRMLLGEKEDGFKGKEDYCRKCPNYHGYIL